MEAVSGQISFGVEKRRLSITPEEARVQMHLAIQKAMPSTELFESLNELLAQEKMSGNKGLRERAVKFMLEKVMQAWEQREQSDRDAFPRQSIPIESFLDTIREGNIYIETYSTFRALNPQVVPAHAFDSETVWLELVQQLLPNSLVGELSTHRGWDLGRSSRFVAKLACRLYKLFLSTHPLAEIRVTTILFFLRNLSSHLKKHTSDESYFGKKLLTDTALKTSQALPAIAADQESSMSGLQTELDRAAISKIEKMPKTMRLENTLGVVRRATDTIRREIPALLSKGVGLQELFWRIHTIHFGEDPFLSQSLSGIDSSVFGYITTYGSERFYTQSTGKTRRVDVHSGSTDGSFAHLANEYLQILELDFFKALEALPDNLSRDEVFNVITLCDYFLETAHLPFDGSGRTIEDFLVGLAKKYGIDVTISTSGYRAVSSGLMVAREESTKRLKTEVRKRCLTRLGVSAIGNPFYTFESLINGIATELEISESDARQVYFSEMALFCNEIVQMLKRQQFSVQTISRRLANTGQVRDVWERAEKQHYIFTPPEMSKTMDTIFAMIAEAGKNRYNLISLIVNVAKIVRQLRGSDDIVTLAKESYYRLCSRKNQRQAETYYKQLFPDASEFDL